MATLIELSAITDDAGWNDLLKKIRAATAIKAAAVINSATPGATVLEWAKGAIRNPASAGDELAFYVVSTNSSATIAQIFGATDAAIQSNVDAAVDAIYGA